MEGLLNYSSEDEQEEFKIRTAAERGGTNTQRRSNNLGRINCSTSAHQPNSALRDGSNGGTYREEQKHKIDVSITSNSGSRTRISECNDNRNRKSREPKDTRDYKEHVKDNKERSDCKTEHARNRSKDYKTEHKRDNSRNVRKDDERKRFKPRKSDREEKTRHNESVSSSSSRRQASQQHGRRHSPDSRYERGADRSTDRHRRRDSKHYRHRESRSRSRSHSRERAVRPLERARLSALEMERKNKCNDSPKSSSEIHHSETQLGRTIVPLMSLPLSNIAPKQPNVIAATNILPTATTVAEPLVVQLPSYYNPSVINPSKYAEQQKKRKLLWGAKKTEDTAAKWGNAHFSQDSDGKVASKFMRLMGIKGGGGGAAATTCTTNAELPKVDASKSPNLSPPLDIQKREAMFSKMEQQYEVARQVTHTMRGVGLGFSSQPRSF